MTPCLTPDDPGLATVIQDFSARANTLLSGAIQSVLLHGSVVLGDFRPARGDLDFIAILDRPLESDECQCLYALHDDLRGGAMGPLGAQLEGIYYPLRLLREGPSIQARGCYIGTRRAGWKEQHTLCTGAYEMAIIMRHGIVAFGRDLRPDLLSPDRLAVLRDILTALQSSVRVCADPAAVGFALHLYSMIPRALHFLAVDAFVGKTQACRWYLQTNPTSPWSDYVRAVLSEREIGLPDLDLRNRPAIVADAAEFCTHAISAVTPRRNCDPGHR